MGKLKKILKKVGKAALIGGAGYLAMKGLKNKKENKAFLKTEGGDKSDMRDYGPFTKAPKKKATPKVYQDDIMKGGSGTKYVDKYAGTPLRRLQNSPLRTDGLGDMDIKDGGRANYKHGGSTGSSKSSGCEIKGTSPILMKGKR